jgi:superfamily I DNA/RNA helicase/mRNA-degrading endonuclease RelE of RelBE toxin-antitoxin system
MAHELLMKPAFLKDCFLLTKKDQKKLTAAVKVIKNDPFSSDGHVKKLQKYKNVYRYKIPPIRVIYATDKKSVLLLGVGNRSNIYERFNPNRNKISIPKIDEFDAEPVVIQTAHFDQSEIKKFEFDSKVEISNDDPIEAYDEPSIYNEEFLERLKIPNEYWSFLLNCKDELEVMDLDIPDEIKEIALGWRPSNIAQIIKESVVLELPDPEQIELYLAGTLKGFLLKLDPEQEKLARKSLKGPTMVKGGPGTGKSLVALYRIRNLLKPDSQLTIFGDYIPKILFVTYTKTLIEASKQLLEPLIGEHNKKVEINNIDKIVRQIVLSCGLPFNPASPRAMTEALNTASKSLLDKESTDKFLLMNFFNKLGTHYLIDEFKWVVEGRQILTPELYLQEDRIGRGIRLDQKERSWLWELHKLYLQELEKIGKQTWGTLRLWALKSLTEDNYRNDVFDVVIVDEAQDLTPVALRICLALCKDPEGLYMTADYSQSIYQRGFSWNRVDSAIQVRGRTTILKYNYRSTQQISDGALQLLKRCTSSDPETVSLIPVNQGPRPRLIQCASRKDEIVEAARFIRSSIKELGLQLDSAAVLVRTNKLAEDVVREFEALNLNAKQVIGDSIQLDSQKIKVMTIHSAKGLEFPVVAVVRVDRDQFPLMMNARDIDEREARLEEERRLLAVGMSRAMRRLAVIYDHNWPSIFIKELDLTLWNTNEDRNQLRYLQSDLR